MRKFVTILFSTAVPAMFATLGTAVAADTRVPPPKIASPNTDAAVRAYWTPERILNAKPADLVVQGAPGRGHKHNSSPELSHRTPGAAPTVRYDGSLATQLYDSRHSGSFPVPPLVGGSGRPYTTNKLYPVGDHTISRIYPYATVGQLYFHEPNGDFVCSASVIRLNTLATAGHCVADGNGNYYTNWLFVPAENGSTGPFGSWTWVNANTTTDWYYGGGVVPNEQDDAVIILKQRKYQNVLHKLGDLTGYLGYYTNSPAPNAITQLGYPCNLDSCTDPVATYAQSVAGPTNNFEWGTSSFGGASGGPEIQDFGQSPSGVAGGNEYLVSSTSYTYSTSYQSDGGSILWNAGQSGKYNFGDDIAWACSNGGC